MLVRPASPATAGGTPPTPFPGSTTFGRPRAPVSLHSEGDQPFPARVIDSTPHGTDAPATP